MFGGEGLFVTNLTGPGRVWLQGMPADRMIAEIARRIPSGGPGIGIPIGGGGGGSGVDAAGAEAGAEAAGVTGGGEEMVAATDAAIDADRQATVATSGVMSSDDVDGDSPGALFGDAVSDDAASLRRQSDDAIPTDDGFGNHNDFATDSTEPQFDDSADRFSTSDENTFKDEGFFEDSSTEGLGEAASEAAESGGGLLSTLWNFFTGGD
jgi:hypothetical protein